MSYIVTGDTHGRNYQRIHSILTNTPTAVPIDGIIILGDAGFNFYLNETDERNKKAVDALGTNIYCVRGNHEERPENIPEMEEIYDESILGSVRYEPRFPHIRYLKDGEVYYFDGYSALVIGGAYSVDKYYRLARYPEGSAWTGWFADEQLTQEEMFDISTKYNKHAFNFVLSHTCPFSWQPTDLFLSGINQLSVDNTMEHWLDDFKNTIHYTAWLFGHFHDDRLVRPGVEMFYTDSEELETIYDRWHGAEQIPWWLKRDPRYDEGR